MADPTGVPALCPTIPPGRRVTRAVNLHPELHVVLRIGWLRAAVLGAYDGIVSAASLIVGVAAASAARSEILAAGIGALVGKAV